MKTVFDRNPEFSLTYTHRGISVTLSGEVLLEAYLSTAGSAQENEQLLGLVVENALSDAASQAGQLLKRFHPEFEAALAKGLTPDLRRSFSSPKFSPCNQCNEIIVAKYEDGKE